MISLQSLIDPIKPSNLLYNESNNYSILQIGILDAIINDSKEDHPALSHRNPAVQFILNYIRSKLHIDRSTHTPFDIGYQYHIGFQENLSILNQYFLGYLSLIHYLQPINQISLPGHFSGYSCYTTIRYSHITHSYLLDSIQLKKIYSMGYNDKNITTLSKG